MPKISGAPEAGQSLPMHSHQGLGPTAADREPVKPLGLPESNFNRSHVEPVVVAGSNPIGTSNLHYSEVKKPEPLNWSAAEKQPERPVVQQSGLQQSQKLSNSTHQLPAEPQRDQRPADAIQAPPQTPQTSEFQYRDGFYSGESDNGLPHGQGTFTNGEFTYVGPWAKGNMHGKCTIEE
jgi:hypothetical protein